MTADKYDYYLLYQDEKIRRADAMKKIISHLDPKIWILPSQNRKFIPNLGRDNRSLDSSDSFLYQLKGNSSVMKRFIIDPIRLSHEVAHLIRSNDSHIMEINYGLKVSGLSKNDWKFWNEPDTENSFLGLREDNNFMSFESSVNKIQKILEQATPEKTKGEDVNKEVLDSLTLQQVLFELRRKQDLLLQKIDFDDPVYKIEYSKNSWQERDLKKSNA